jgi:ABC-type cobalamin transport system ATPase subunit
MSLAVMARFSPLLKFAGRPVGTFTAAEIAEVAMAFAGQEGAEGLAPLLEYLAKLSPESTATQLLSTPEAQTLFQNFLKGIDARTKEEDSTVFCRCPSCGTRFEQIFA